MKSSALLLFLVGLAALAGTMGARPDPLTRAAPHGIGEAATLTRESARTGWTPGLGAICIATQPCRCRQ